MLHDSYLDTKYTPGLSHRRNGVDQVYHTDWLGSTRYLSQGTDGNSFPTKLRYEGFGKRTSVWTGPDHPTDFQFGAGWGYQSEHQTSTEPGLGLHYLEQRYYDPVVGRFISPDPLAFLGSENRYDYVGSDPVNSVDPEGLWGIRFGRRGIGNDRPWLVFDRDVWNRAAGTIAAARDAVLHGRDPGEYANEPGYATSAFFARVNKGAFETAVTLGCGGGGPGRSLSVRRGGSYAALNKTKASNEVPHHIPQAAWWRSRGRSGKEGPAILLDKVTEHPRTRTFGGKGVATMRTDAGLSGRQRLARDVRDVRNKFGKSSKRVEIRQALDYAYTLPEFARVRVRYRTPGKR